MTLYMPLHGMRLCGLPEYRANQLPVALATVAGRTEFMVCGSPVVKARTSYTCYVALLSMCGLSLCRAHPPPKAAVVVALAAAATVAAAAVAAEMVTTTDGRLPLQIEGDLPGQCLLNRKAAV